MHHARLTRDQALRLLELATVRLDALIGHRDGSFTVKLGYAPHEDGDALLQTVQYRLTRYTRATILQAHHARRARYPRVEVRFAFDKMEKEQCTWPAKASRARRSI